eukprot:756995-Hanusia_phi.AAC.1
MRMLRVGWEGWREQQQLGEQLAKLQQTVRETHSRAAARQALTAIKVFVCYKREKRSKERAALEDRRKRFLRDGAARWIKAGTQEIRYKHEKALSSHMEKSSKAYARAASIAKHWLALTLSRRSQRMTGTRDSSPPPSNPTPPPSNLFSFPHKRASMERAGAACGEDTRRQCKESPKEAMEVLRSHRPAPRRPLLVYNDLDRSTSADMRHHGEQAGQGKSGRSASKVSHQLDPAASPGSQRRQVTEARTSLALQEIHPRDLFSSVDMVSHKPGGAEQSSKRSPQEEMDEIEATLRDFYEQHVRHKEEVNRLRDLQSARDVSTVSDG